jgi:hypothetical protein
MPTIRQQIEVAADPALVSNGWRRFVEWAHTGSGRLVCDELACVDAVRAGLVEFAPARAGRTTVIFRIDRAADGPSRDELQRRVRHDLVVFKDYVERGGPAAGDHTETEKAALGYESGRKGDKPRHTQLSSENDTTFWRSHFPT